MARSDTRTLINLGRKAGLRTSELYTALASRPPEGNDGPRQTDSNGYVAEYNLEGRPTYHPVETPPPTETA